MRETVGANDENSNNFSRSRCAKVGMAEDLYQHNEAATKILNQSQEVMDFDYSKPCLQTKNKIKSNRIYATRACYAHSIALLHALEHIDADYTLGHSHEC